MVSLYNKDILSQGLTMCDANLMLHHWRLGGLAMAHERALTSRSKWYDPTMIDL